MMKKEQGLHELNQYLTNYVNLESFIVLSLDIAVNVHTKQLCNDALEYWMNYDMATKLEVSFDLDNVFVAGGRLLDDFHDGHFEFELMVQLLANLNKSSFYFQYFECVLLFVFMVHYFQDFSECTRSDNFQHFEAICDMISNQWFVIVILVSESVFVLRRA